MHWFNNKSVTLMQIYVTKMIYIVLCFIFVTQDVLRTPCPKNTLNSELIVGNQVLITVNNPIMLGASSFNVFFYLYEG